MRGLYVTKDLLFSSQVTSAVRRAGGQCDVVGTLEQVHLRFAEAGYRWLLLDLEAGVEPAAIEVLFTEGARPVLVAYGPHVHGNRLDAAREAGFDQVLTRGQLSGQLPQLLAMWGSQSGEGA